MVRRRSKSATTDLARWRIVRLKATPAADLGTVEAPTAAEAIKAAIERFNIRNPQHQQRLMACRIGS